MRDEGVQASRAHSGANSAQVVSTRDEDQKSLLAESSRCGPPSSDADSNDLLVLGLSMRVGALEAFLQHLEIQLSSLATSSAMPQQLPTSILEGPASGTAREHLSGR